MDFEIDDALEKLVAMGLATIDGNDFVITDNAQSYRQLQQRWNI